jgi:hypothetical protein
MAAYLGLMVYRAAITHNETDLLFLAEETPTSLHQENEEIIERDVRLEPISRGLGGLAIVMTVMMLCVYVFHELNRGHLIS